MSLELDTRAAVEAARDAAREHGHDLEQRAARPGATDADRSLAAQAAEFIAAATAAAERERVRRAEMYQWAIAFIVEQAEHVIGESFEQIDNSRGRATALQFADGMANWTRAEIGRLEADCRTDTEHALLNFWRDADAQLRAFGRDIPPAGSRGEQ